MSALVPGRVVVCGAGVIGAAVAYFLSRRGIAVTVIERTGVACAASGKSGGFIALDWCDNSELGPLARVSFALHARLAEEITTDYGYRRMDTYMVAAREHGTVPGGHRIPAPRWIDGETVVAGALGSLETTAQVHPARFTRALLDAALTRGGELRMGRVEGVSVAGGAAQGVMVDGELLRADVVVLAMGPWTGRAAGLSSLPPIHGLKGYSVTLDAPDVPADALFMDYRLAGEVYVCGMADRRPLPESAEGVEVSETACNVLARAAGRVSSGLAAAAITKRQACYRPVTDDGLPLIGPVPDVRNAFVATGHGPWGMLNAPATGLALAERIVDGRAICVDLRPFDPARLPAARR